MRYHKMMSIVFTHFLAFLGGASWYAYTKQKVEKNKETDADISALFKQERKNTTPKFTDFTEKRA